MVLAFLQDIKTHKIFLIKGAIESFSFLDVACHHTLFLILISMIIICELAFLMLFTIFCNEPLRPIQGRRDV